MNSRHIRTSVGVAALVVGAGLAARGSAGPDVLGRYSLLYFILLVAYLPVLGGALLVWIAGGDAVLGFRRLKDSRAFRVILVMLLVPAAAVGIRFVGGGADLDAVRVLALLGLALGVTLTALALGGRRTSTALGAFQVGLLVALGGIYLATFTITPLLGSRIERAMGLPAESTFRLTGPPGYTGDLHEPGASFVYTGPEGSVPEFAVTVQNNSWGFHDRERTFADPESLRMVVLGDDYVQALEVPRDSAFPALLEQRLRPDHPGAEVIRLARRSVGQERELELLRHYGTGLRPDLVVLVWATNDLLDNHPRLATLNPWVPDAILFPGLLLDRLATGWLQKRLYLIDERYRLGVLRPDYWAYLRPSPPEVEAAFERTASLLDRIVALTRTLDSELMIVVKRPTNELRWLHRFPGLRSYELDVDAHAMWLADYAESREVGFLDLGPPFQAYYDEHPTGHPDQYSWPHAGHLREPGHRLMAGLLHAELVRSGLLNPRPQVDRASSGDMP